MGTRLNQYEFDEVEKGRLDATASAITGEAFELTTAQWRTAYLTLMSDDNIRDFTSQCFKHMQMMEAQLGALTVAFEESKREGAPVFVVQAVADAHKTVKTAHDRAFNPIQDETYDEGVSDEITLVTDKSGE